MSTAARLPAVSEDTEQAQIIYWCRVMSAAHPELELIYHVPNEGKRSRAAAGKQSAIGLRSGVPDLVLPVARLGYHGLYIELKAVGGRVSDNQIDWLERLSREGYAVAVCYGAEEAIAMLTDYIKQGGNGHYYSGAELEQLRPKHRSARRGHLLSKAIIAALLIIAADIIINGALTGVSVALLIVAAAITITAFYTALLRAIQ